MSTRDYVTRAHGKPMLCPVCEGEVFIDAPHVCPPGFVKPARGVNLFFGYESLNECCRGWLLLGWPSDDHQQPRDPGTADWVKSYECPKCKRPLHFDIAHPKIKQMVSGKAQPPAIVAGRIR